MIPNRVQQRLNSAILATYTLHQAHWLLPGAFDVGTIVEKGSDIQIAIQFGAGIMAPCS